MGAGGTERLAGVLGQCVALAHLDRGMTSALSGKGSFELRGVVNDPIPLIFSGSSHRLVEYCTSEIG
jgi:hypothetical protein